MMVDYLNVTFILLIPEVNYCDLCNPSTQPHFHLLDGLDMCMLCPVELVQGLPEQLLRKSHAVNSSFLFVGVSKIGI